MKKIFLQTCLLLFIAAALLSAGCATQGTPDEVISSLAISGITGIGICFVVIMALVGLFFFVIWIIALVDCAKRKPDEFPAGTGGENAKTLWLVILIVTFFVSQLNGIAAIVYYFMVMKKMPRKE